MAQYNGVDKEEIVASIDGVLDLILADGKISHSERAVYDWIDGRKLAILRQSSSDEELARNMRLTGADKIFAQNGGFLLRLEFNCSSAKDLKTIERLKSWNAFNTENRPVFKK